MCYFLSWYVPPPSTNHAKPQCYQSIYHIYPWYPCRHVWTERRLTRRPYITVTVGLEMVTPFRSGVWSTEQCNFYQKLYYHLFVLWWTLIIQSYVFMFLISNKMACPTQNKNNKMKYSLLTKRRDEKHLSVLPLCQRFGGIITGAVDTWFDSTMIFYSIITFSYTKYFVHS